MALGKIKADTLEHSTVGTVDTQYVVNGSAKARHASSADGATLYGSFNVSSLGDTATGKETITFTNAMSDLNYSAVSGSGSQANGSARMMLIDSLATTSYQVHGYNNSNALGDTSSSSTVHGDLA